MPKKLGLLSLAMLTGLSIVPVTAWALHCEVGEPLSYKSPHDLEECPIDIQSWMDRTNGCIDLDRQEAENPHLSADLEEARYEMECEYLACDYQRMLAKYRGNGVLTNIIKGYKKVAFGEKPMTCEEDFRPDVLP